MQLFIFLFFNFKIDSCVASQAHKAKGKVAGGDLHINEMHKMNQVFYLSCPSSFVSEFFLFISLPSYCHCYPQ